jgi:hypothetical protein
MKNTYIKLFERLAEEIPNSIIPIEKFSDLGFFLTDFERMHKEGFVFLERINELVDKKHNSHIIKHYVKLAPRGFASLEEFNRNERQENVNSKTLKATIIIAIATALNVLITLFVFILNLEKSNWAKPVSLTVFGVLIAGLSGILIKEIWYFLFPKKVKE